MRRQIDPIDALVVECFLQRRLNHLEEGRNVEIEKTKQYGVWVNDAEIGILAGYMDARRVRIYLKDTLMKPYARARDSDSAAVMSALGLDVDTGILGRYERPHGLLLIGNRVVCWGKADDWKLILMTTHERAFHIHVEPFAAVLLPPLTRFVTVASRAVIEDAARKLGIDALGWHDPQTGSRGTEGRRCCESRWHFRDSLGLVALGDKHFRPSHA